MFPAAPGTFAVRLASPRPKVIPSCRRQRGRNGHIVVNRELHAVRSGNDRACPQQHRLREGVSQNDRAAGATDRRDRRSRRLSAHLDAHRLHEHGGLDLGRSICRSGVTDRDRQVLEGLAVRFVEQPGSVEAVEPYP